jgi:hypothetical protein
MMLKHYKTKQVKSWNQVKGLLVARFGGVVPAARHFGCHRNSVRNAFYGRCPGIAKKLKAEGLL